MKPSLGTLEQGLAFDESGHIDNNGTIRKSEYAQQDVFKAGLVPPRGASNPRQRRSRKTAAMIGFFVLSYLFIHFDGIDYTPVGINRSGYHWLELCGYSGWIARNHTEDTYLDVVMSPEDLSNDSRVVREIPQYVLDYAPLVHLFSGEHFWPGDIAEHLFHVTPELNYTPIQGRLQYSNLTNLDKLNDFEHGRHVYLTSNDNVEERPDWLGGEKNIPDEFDDDDSGGKSGADKLQIRSKGGRSNAPAVLVVVNKGKGIVDAFWFFFYSYNLGNKVFNIRFGNHVGDWEHTLIRFQHGKPQLVYLSEHNFGEAYSYDAVEKIGARPVVYSATGSHAMYATPGAHPYVLPLGILHDQTDRGPLWDPALNSHTYIYNHLTDKLHPSNFTPRAPTEWFYFAGHWGDKFYPLDDDRQYGLAGEYHYVSGPLGPRFKHLSRRKVCQGGYSEPCVIKHWLDVDEVKVWPSLGQGEDWPEDPEIRPPELRQQ